MAIKTTGSLALSEVQTEFFGSNPIGLSEYRGGYVPVGTINKDGATIPSTGSISMSQFYGSERIPNPLPVRVLIVAGGGGGGVRYGWDNAQWNGGGGAGGYLDLSLNFATGSTAITVGSGGWYGTTNNRDTTSGANSRAFGYTAIGGGHGGGSDGGQGVVGGSGGGGPGGGAAGTTGQGNAGWAGGGGAGYAAGYGFASGNSAHNGGPGRQWIDGNFYAGGGSSSAGTRSIPGGGGYTFGAFVNGAYWYTSDNGVDYYYQQWNGGFQHGGNHATYYGGGGQGGATKFGGVGAGFEGGAGYQGVVIVSYQWNFQVLTGGNSIYNDGASGKSKRWYHRFTSSGTLYNNSLSLPGDGGP